MRLFGTHERPDVAKLAKVTREIHEFCRQRDFHADRQRSANPASLLQRVAGIPEQEVDKLIAELQTMRERLRSEGTRVRKRVVDYATLSQSTAQSAKVISECLRNGLMARRQALASLRSRRDCDAAKPDATE